MAPGRWEVGGREGGFRLSVHSAVLISSIETNLWICALMAEFCLFEAIINFWGIQATLATPGQNKYDENE